MKNGAWRARASRPKTSETLRKIHSVIRCRNRRTSHSTHIAKTTLAAPVSEGSENIHRLQGFARNGRLSRFSQPDFPASIFAVSVTQPDFGQIVFGMGYWSAFAQAFSNAVQTACRKTRGFTSCPSFGIIQKNIGPLISRGTLPV